MPSNKSNLLKQLSNINSYGFRRKKAIPFSALEKHSIVFENKNLSLSLSDIRTKIADFKSKHREIKEKRLEGTVYSKKQNLSILKEKSLSLRLEISKLEVLENLILQKELLKQTPELSSLYLKTFKNISKKVDVLFKDTPSSLLNKKYTFLSLISKELTRQLKLRNEESRKRLFNYINREILTKPLDQLRLDV